MFEFDHVLELLRSPSTLGLPEDAVAEFLKLVAAAATGLVVTKVRKHQSGRPLPLPLEQAMMLLTLTGALMMIVIGNSLPRALGIAGAAAIVRFRTPVEDPRDTTLFLILLGLGMTCGLGALPLAGLAALFVCAFLLVLNRMAQNSPRHLELEVVANSTSFPASRVERVLSARGIKFELHEMAVDTDVKAKYLVELRHDMELKTLSDDLMLAAGEPPLSAVSWSEKKWMRQ
jgi:hypothetical protein